VAHIHIVHGHQPYPFAKGRLNQTLTDRARDFFEKRGDEVTVVHTAKGWDVDNEIRAHQQADTVILQFPANWMGVPWSLKKYMDEVYTAGMDGRLCAGDGRHGPGEDAKYGLGGALDGNYMLSVTFNAPEDAFANANAPFFEGKSVDDLLWPMHLNMRFFGMRPLPTYSAHDVMKNPNVEQDLVRFDTHLDTTFPKGTS